LFSETRGGTTSFSNGEKVFEIFEDPEVSKASEVADAFDELNRHSFLGSNPGKRSSRAGEERILLFETGG
jgi:hypothetical protein